MAEKTLLLAREEMVQQITDTIIRSGVPLIVIEPVMERMLTEVRAALQQQYQKEKTEYEAAVAKEQEAEENE